MSLGPRLYFGVTPVTRLSVIDQYWEPAAEPDPQRLNNAIDAAITPLADRQADDS